MVYSIQNNMAYINGSSGMYDGKINNTSVKYGRNAASNLMEFLKPPKTDVFDVPKLPPTSDLLKMKLDEVEKALKPFDEIIDSTEKSIETKPPLDFEYRYMPESANGNNLDKMALLGAAFEEMGREISMPIQEFVDKLKLLVTNPTADAIDLNKDGKIDLAEYSSTIIATDMFSKDNSKVDVNNINGTINDKGLASVQALVNGKNIEKANEILTAIYNAYNLGEAKTEFLKDSNNTLDLLA